MVLWKGCVGKVDVSEHATDLEDGTNPFKATLTNLDLLPVTQNL